ncbi:cytochrome P450 [Podospora fimiseda]|uniref:Cytochrome P450 n=1 Tax=Podospora fimiseda TaxID=252190 RepID=A0AAN6YT94_9PEZI|nr:cytochrome P450 [Podospora fimiseda]
MSSLTILLALFLAPLLTFLLYRRIFSPKRSPLPQIPYLEFPPQEDNSFSRYLHDTRSLMRRGYNEYTKKGLPFAMFNHVDFNSPLVILPLKYLEEVRSASTGRLSFPLSLERSTIINDIGGPRMTEEAIRVVRLDVTRCLAGKVGIGGERMERGLVGIMGGKCAEAYKRYMPECKDWTPVNAYQFMLKVFSQVTARTLVGPELCDSKEWLDIILGFTNAAFKASHGVREKYHPLLRWTAKYLDKDVKDVYRIRKRAGELLGTILEKRKQEEKEGIIYEDGIQWLISAYKAAGKELSADQLAQDEFIITIASIHSSSATALSCLYDLMDRREIMEEIKEEIGKVRKEFGVEGSEGWTRQSLAGLKLMDSFMKESQRIHPLQQLTMQRMVVREEGFLFKDGLRLPRYTQISMPNEMIGLDEELHGEDAKEFDAKRWLRKREETGEGSRYHFASISDDMLAFGSGMHACPGRFLAQEVIKLMFVELLEEFEVRYPEGVEKRPGDILKHHNIMPNVGVELLFREQKKS